MAPTRSLLGRLQSWLLGARPEFRDSQFPSKGEGRDVTRVQSFGCVKDVVDEFLKGEGEEVDAAVAEMDESAKKLAAGASPHMSNELLCPIVRKALERNQCKTRGFVLDGFPKNSNVTKLLFTQDVEDGERRGAGA